jgi:hypothetical protein
LKKDLELTVPTEVVREKVLELQEVTIGKKTYAYDPKTRDVYDLESYNRARNDNNKNALIKEGRIMANGKFVPV